MRKIFMIALSCILFSCSSDDSEPDVEGIGIDPELNIYEYTFSNQGDSIEVYSTIGSGIWPIYIGDEADYPEVMTYPQPSEVLKRGFDGGWYSAYFPMGIPAYNIIVIKVEPNDTGNERTVPISIEAGDYFCKTKFVQEK